MNDSDDSKNMKKYYSYKLAFERIALAIESNFPLEAITIEESIICDRLRAYCEANGLEQIPPSFSQLIIKANQLAKNNCKELLDMLGFLNRQPNPIINPSKSIDSWRVARNMLLHGMVKTSRAGQAPEVPANEFMERAIEIAKCGKEHARNICNLSNKLKRQKLKLLKQQMEDVNED